MYPHISLKCDELKLAILNVLDETEHTNLTLQPQLKTVVKVIRT